MEKWIFIFTEKSVVINSVIGNSMVVRFMHILAAFLPRFVTHSFLVYIHKSLVFETKCN